MIVVKSGGEAWGFVIDFDKDFNFVLNALSECIFIARNKYSDEKTYIICNDAELVKQAKKQAEKKLRRK